MSVSAQNQQGSQIIIEGDHNHLQINDFKTLTHRITLPNGTAIEFFADTDEQTFAGIQQELNALRIPSYAEFIAQHRRKHANKSAKLARKRQKQARRKQR